LTVYRLSLRAKMTYNTYMEKTPLIQRSTLTYAQAVDAVGDFWQGKTEPGVMTEALAVVEGRMLAADDPADFVLPTGKTSLQTYNQGF